MIPAIPQAGYTFTYVLLWFVITVFTNTAFAQKVVKSPLLQQRVSQFNLPQNNLAKTLVDFGLQANIAVIVPYDLVEGYSSSPLIGQYTIERALDKILWRSPLTYKLEVDGPSQTIIIQKKLLENVFHTQEPEQDETNTPLMEEFVITGIRASLEKSINIKRFSDGVIDVISAEDIGKFPDTNLAESLQRVTGVSISRENGEGSKLTVRGFGESYNLVTLNGRTMPTASAPGNEVANSRAFDFANLASEGISGVDVHKTSNASVSTGGVGATIDIKTAKPLDNQGLTRYLGLKAVNDSTQRVGRTVTPEVSALLSWTDGKRWGVSAYGSLQERDSGSSGAFVDQWSTFAWKEYGQEGALARHNASCIETGGNPLVDQCSIVVNPPQVGQFYSMPSQLHYTLTDTSRSRNNAQLTVQFKPVDSITTSLDYTLSSNSIQGQRAEQSINFTANRSYIAFDNEPVKTPMLMLETIFDSDGQSSGKGIAFAQQAFDLEKKNTSLGFNLLFEVSKNFKLSMDIHESSAKSGPGDSAFGSWSNVSIGANVVGSQTVDWSRDLPVMDITVNDVLLEPHSNNGIFDAADIGTQVAFAYYSQQHSEVSQIKLDGFLEFSSVGIQFGLDMRDMESHTLYSEIYYTMGDWGITDPDRVPDNFFTPRNFAQEFSDYDTSGFYEGGFDADQDVITDWAVNEYPVFPGAFDYSDNWNEDRTIAEEALALYTQMTVDFDLGRFPSTIVTGIRYEKTDVESVVRVIPVSVNWLDNNDFSVVYSSRSAQFKQRASYNHLLPNLDMAIDVTEELKTRFSYSKTIARAPYDQLSASISGLTVSGVTVEGQSNAVALSGNPGLKPLESDNVDVSFEYYLGDVSYVSLGAYWKGIDNFIGIKAEDKTHFDLRDSSSGPRAQAAVVSLESNSDFDGTITPTDLFNEIAAAQHNDDNLEGDDSYYGDTYDIQPQADDPLYQVTTYAPINNQGANISGLEFAVQHFFGPSGFGFLLNYTTVNGDVSYDVTAPSDAAQLALLGLSDTLNLVGMYEKNGFQLRLAYNWRDEFLAYLSDEPRFTEAYSQLDLMLSYDISDRFILSIEGINLTEENSRQHGRSSTQLWQLEQLGARYMLGARFQF